jgi:hypothetical protein
MPSAAAPGMTSGGSVSAAVSPPILNADLAKGGRGELYASEVCSHRIDRYSGHATVITGTGQTVELDRWGSRPLGI